GPGAHPADDGALLAPGRAGARLVGSLCRWAGPSAGHPRRPAGGARTLMKFNYLKYLLPPAQGWRTARVLAWAAALPLLKYLLPLPRLVLLLRGRATPRGPASSQRTVALILRLYQGRERGGNCLERSLLLYHFLTEADQGPQLVVGVRRGEERTILGHAWVVLDGQPVGESWADLQPFVPVVSF